MTRMREKRDVFVCHVHSESGDDYYAQSATDPSEAAQSANDHDEGDLPTDHPWYQWCEKHIGGDDAPEYLYLRHVERVKR